MVPHVSEESPLPLYATGMRRTEVIRLNVTAFPAANEIFIRGCWIKCTLKPYLAQASRKAETLHDIHLEMPKLQEDRQHPD